jgi:hypothetical protein
MSSLEPLSPEVIPLAKIIVEDHVLFAFHNMPCAVCGHRRAVLMMNTGVFMPCRECAAKGWRITVRRPWWHSLLYRKGYHHA